MKSSQVTLIIIGFVLLALMATNPTLEEHKESVKNMFLKEIEKNRERKKQKNVNEVVASIGSAIADRFIDQMVSRNNYYLFSTTKYSIKDESKIIGFGILGQVFIQDYDEIKNKVENDSDNETDLSNNNKNVPIKEVYIDEPKTSINTDLNDENVYKNVDIEAEIPRGINWTRYITREIERNIDELQDDGRSGTVVINFIVDKEGNVSDVHALPCEEAKVGNCLSPNSKLAEISVNAIKKGPKWVPAQLNGLVVKSYKRRPVTFNLSNN
jgi:type I site-specific restriction-modification system R (restriction) subunit